MYLENPFAKISNETERQVSPRVQLSTSWWPNHPRGAGLPRLENGHGEAATSASYYIRRQAWRYRKVTSLFSHRAVVVFSSRSAVYPAPVTGWQRCTAWPVRYLTWPPYNEGQLGVTVSHSFVRTSIRRSGSSPSRQSVFLWIHGRVTRPLCPGCSRVSANVFFSSTCNAHAISLPFDPLPLFSFRRCASLFAVFRFR